MARDRPRAAAGDTLSLPALRLLRDRFASLSGAAPSREAREQLGHLDNAIANLAGELCDAVAGDERVVPGQRVRVAISCVGLPVSSARLLFRGHPIQAGDDGFVVVPDSVALSRPYFLAEPRVGDLYSWRGVPAELKGVAREPPTLAVTYAGVTREAAFRFNDQSVGEQRRPVTVVPAST